MTGREMLKLFASLRGVSRANVDKEVNKWLSLMGELQTCIQADVLASWFI
jgi:ABC-type multidrug transport system ATPase subunit